MRSFNQMAPAGGVFEKHGKLLAILGTRQHNVHGVCTIGGRRSAGATPHQERR